MQPKIFTLWPVKENRGFPGSPVVKTLDVGGMSSILGWEPKILHAMWLGQKIEKKKEKKMAASVLCPEVCDHWFVLKAFVGSDQP